MCELKHTLSVKLAPNDIVESDFLFDRDLQALERVPLGVRDFATTRMLYT